MAEVVHDDVVEHILIGLDVEDLISCMRVCKSWHSLITSPRFVTRHLNHSYNKDRYNNELVHRRIVFITHPGFGSHHLVGSCNGLVCISSLQDRKVFVGNPLTREDDYTIVAVANKGENRSCVQVLSLKSNVWRAIGEVKYVFISWVGFLYNGALHWIVEDQNRKLLILSYDLSKEEFIEIPKPDDARYECTYTSRLGIVKECLCIFRGYGYSSNDVWLMKNYNVKESWELLPQRDRDHDKKYDSVHFFNSGLPKDVDASWFCSAMEHKYWLHMDPHYYYIHAPIFVKSLVSPYVNGRRQRSAMIGELDSPGLRSLLPWNDTDAPIFVRSLVSLHVNMERPKQASNNKRIAKVGSIYIMYRL
ncbi:putative F-box domain, galactose oxidase/kelch, beta-propeller, F-box associated interaction [Helianthus annuus]|uniref:F-box domain, galactose oxidase/kelch, beta-propeller, F-box associated interaction n=1 Tax=Helianthus annuus TaxID=4232 RepID=A0A251VK92_HELAN|nr:putative F-box domain, galactose oxidase/kelch, beta-propeller, F-box associated interaction [Helianthus annuus]KAJ0620156.1 putative F-box domain, galactose oxidase/kelch, beta-propeller, F-box associated interaction [Helianthus annuus]